MQMTVNKPANCARKPRKACPSIAGHSRPGHENMWNERGGIHFDKPIRFSKWRAVLTRDPKTYSSSVGHGFMPEFRSPG
jgi:hypothetical protein